MGNTYRREKSFDDLKRNHKKLIAKEFERKEIKNRKFSEYYQEEYDEDDFEDEYDTDFDDSLDDEDETNFTTTRK